MLSVIDNTGCNMTFETVLLWDPYLALLCPLPPTYVWFIFLQEEYDTYDPKGPSSIVLPFLRKRSKIIEIVAAQDIVFALAQSGVCAAFNRGNTTEALFSAFYVFFLINYAILS